MFRFDTAYAVEGAGGGFPPPQILSFAWYGRYNRPYQAKRRYLGGPVALQTSHQSADRVRPMMKEKFQCKLHSPMVAAG